MRVGGGADRRRRRLPYCARPLHNCLMFERPTGGDRALLVALDFGDGDRDYAAAPS